MKTREAEEPYQITSSYTRVSVVLLFALYALVPLSLQSTVVRVDSRRWNDIDDRQVQQVVADHQQEENRAARTDHETAQSQHNGILISRGIGRAWSKV